MQTLVIIGLLLLLVVIWAITKYRTLMVLEENSNNAMYQIGVQLSSRYDVLVSLIKRFEWYSKGDSHNLNALLQRKRVDITSEASPEDVLEQEKVIADVLQYIFECAERYPEFKQDAFFEKAIGAMESYAKMIRTSSLIYNDCVTRLNEAIKSYPIRMLAGIFGVRYKGYIEVGDCHSVV